MNDLSCRVYVTTEISTTDISDEFVYYWMLWELLVPSFALFSPSHGSNRNHVSCALERNRTRPNRFETRTIDDIAIKEVRALS